MKRALTLKTEIPGSAFLKIIMRKGGEGGHGLYKPTAVSLRMTVWKRFFNYFTSFE